ncbi:MAG: cobalt-precorrin 5A hydrolase [Bacilli bacterium]
MNKIYILSFTKKGYELSRRLMQFDDYEIACIRVNNLKESIKKIYRPGITIIFIGAVGIAVRGIAKYINHKSTDPAVIVIDEKGNYVIPILSGHIGGANEMSEKIAKCINAISVITTATDINNVFSIDLYAKKHNYMIKNFDGIKRVSAKLLADQTVYLSSEFEINGALPNNIKFSASVGDVHIGVGLNENSQALILQPKVYHLGVGCKKETSRIEFEKFLLNKLKEFSISIDLVATISSIDLKQSEQAIIEFAKKYNIDFITYTAKELLEYEEKFFKSDFVKTITGVSNICETCGYKSSNEGKTVVNRTAKNGITLSVFKQEFIVEF